nr:MAG TPA: transposase [Caudoviricetes sp.]
MKFRLPKDEEEKRLELYKQGFNDREIAEKLMYSKTEIFRWRTTRGLPPNGSTINFLSVEKDRQRMELFNQGLTDKEIADKVGLKECAIKRWRRNKGLKKNVR